MQMVALLGPDGAGKSTQAWRLTERLKAAGYRAKYVRPVFLLFDPWRLRDNPNDVPAFSPRRHGRALFAGDPNPPAKARLQTALMAGIGYVYAVATYIYLRTLLHRERFVVCDRYFYQFFFDLWGRAASRIALAFPPPHIAFYLDGSPETLNSRTEEYDDSQTYLENLLAFFREISPCLGFREIDATADERSVGERIWRSLWKATQRAGA